MTTRVIGAPAGCALWLLLLLPPLPLGAAAGGAVDEVGAVEPFDFGGLIRRAEALASRPFEEEDDPIPEVLRGLDYDRYRALTFRPEHALWRDEGLPFEVQFFHRGYLFERRVRINIIDGDGPTPVTFSRELFDYGPGGFAEELPDDLGFAGFRLHYPLNRYDHRDEFLVFLGASYFRAVGQDQVYGLSARGLALDAGRPAEEFPFFREFWIERPTAAATAITLYALLDGPSVTGAYRFVARPGPETVLTVDARIFARTAVGRLGLAPLTSMFWYGENSVPPEGELRPEVHDSDGLLLATGGGELIWRPLANPAALRISAFGDTGPRGFGLLQRDRAVSHYRAREALYHRRPSAWVEPLGDWGRGAVELVEIPTDAEYYDNIVALWVPAEAIEPGHELAFGYRLRFAPDPPASAPAGRTVATRIEPGTTAAAATRFVLEFDGATLRALDGGAAVEAVVSASSGGIAAKAVEKNEVTEGWRASFELVPEGDERVELSCFLKFGSAVVTETWRYSWQERGRERAAVD